MILFDNIIARIVGILSNKGKGMKIIIDLIVEKKVWLWLLLLQPLIAFSAVIDDAHWIEEEPSKKGLFRRGVEATGGYIVKGTKKAARGVDKTRKYIARKMREDAEKRAILSDALYDPSKSYEENKAILAKISKKRRFLENIKGTPEERKSQREFFKLVWNTTQRLFKPLHRKKSKQGKKTTQAVTGTPPEHEEEILPQAGILPEHAALGLATLIGLHFYHQWPIQHMIDLQADYNRNVGDSRRKNALNVAELMAIKDNEDFWYNVLYDINEYKRNERVRTAIERLLAANDRQKINTLLNTAIERLELMHGVWKYSPAGWYRRARELTSGAVY